jgi:uncharacterized membrane protein
VTPLSLQEGGWILLNARPAFLAALLVVSLLATVSGFRSNRGLPAGRRALLLAVRVLTVAVVGLAVLRPARETDIVRPVRAPLAVLVDESRSMVLGPKPVGPEAARWFEQRGGLEALREFYEVESFGLGDPPPVLDLQALAGGAAFEGKATPLGRTVEALAKARPELAGIVLFSDGRDTERLRDPPTSLSVPVYPVLASSGEVSDLRIEAVETPPVAFIRTPTEVRVRLGLSGFAPGTAAVTLLEGGKPVQSQTVPLTKEGATATLSFTPTRTGRKAYRVEVAPWPGDAAPENNRAQFALHVIRDKTRILLVAGTPTWDVKYLRRRLTQDPGIDLISFLILRTPEDVGLVAQDELSLIPFPTEELFNQELPSFDAVIFANFDYAPYVPRQYLGNLVRFVRENGGGFAMLGGDRSFALGGYAGTPLEEILPLELGGASPGQEYAAGRFRPRLTAAGVTHPLFQWKEGAAENRLFWNSLPEMEGMNWTLRPKPAAVVLAENPQARNEHGPLPLIASGEYGAGRTLLIATDSLWRWASPGAGSSGDDSAYRDFWSRALRWLSHDPEMELVRLSPPAGPLRAGERLRLRARVFTRSYEPASGAQLQGSLSTEEGRKTPLRWRETSAGEYAADPVSLSEVGLWTAEVEAVLAGAPLGRDSAELPVEPESPERLRVGVDHAYLEALARASGGRTFPLEGKELQEFLSAKGRRAVEVVGRRVEEKWASPWLLLLAVGLFGLDWSLRRFWE